MAVKVCLSRLHRTAGLLGVVWSESADDGMRTLQTGTLSPLTSKTAQRPAGRGEASVEFSPQQAARWFRGFDSQRRGLSSKPNAVQLNGEGKAATRMDRPVTFI